MRCPTVSNWKSSCCICISTGVGGSRYSLTLASSVCEQNLSKTRQKNQHVATKYRSQRERQEFLSINPAAFEMCFTTALWWLSWRSTAPPDTWKKVASQFHLLVEHVVADFFFFFKSKYSLCWHFWSPLIWGQRSVSIRLTWALTFTSLLSSAAAVGAHEFPSETASDASKGTLSSGSRVQTHTVYQQQSAVL